MMEHSVGVQRSFRPARIPRGEKVCMSGVAREVRALIGDLVNCHVKVIRKPAINSKIAYLSALRGDAGIERSAGGEVFFPISPKNVKPSLLCSLEALLDKSIKDVSIIFKGPSDNDIRHFVSMDNGCVYFYIAGGKENKIDHIEFMGKRPKLFIEPHGGREAAVTASVVCGFRGLWRVLKNRSNVIAVRMPREESVSVYFAALKEALWGQRFAYGKVLWAISHEDKNKYPLYLLKECLIKGLIKSVTVLDTEQVSAGIAPLFDDKGRFSFFGSVVTSADDMDEYLDNIHAVLFVKLNEGWGT
jgi:hypothetical protein